MKTAVLPVNSQTTGPAKVMFCDTEDEVTTTLEKWGGDVNLIYAGTVENLPEIYKQFISNDKHPLFEDAKLNYENVIIFQWNVK